MRNYGVAGGPAVIGARSCGVGREVHPDTDLIWQGAVMALYSHPLLGQQFTRFIGIRIDHDSFALKMTEQ